MPTVKAPYSPIPANIPTDSPEFRVALNNALLLISQSAQQPDTFIAVSHNVRLTQYPASAQTPPLECFETDRGVRYYVRQGAGNAKSWVYETGEMFGLFAARPADLTNADAGFLFFATDTLARYRWSGSGWVTV
jgi:hypothetical protein